MTSMNIHKSDMSRVKLIGMVMSNEKYYSPKLRQEHINESLQRRN